MERLFFQSVHVAGFSYYEGAFLLPEMKVGSPVELVPDEQNKFDENAVEIRFKGRKIGYLPREENAAIAKILRAGYDIFEGVIQQISPDQHPEHQVRIGIFVKVRKSARPASRGKRGE